MSIKGVQEVFMHEPGGKGASHCFLPGQGLLGQIQGGSGGSVKSPKLKQN